MSNAKVNQIQDLAEYTGVCIVAQHQDGKNLPITFELIHEGMELARKTKSKLTVLILGFNIQEEVNEIAHYGADEIIYFENELLKEYSTDLYTKTVSDYLKDNKFEIVIFGASSIGRDYAPRVAARIGTGLVADCTKLDIREEDGLFLQTRPAFGGNLMATIICPNDRPQMATVRPGVMETAIRINQKSKIVTLHPNLSEEDIIAKTIKVIRDKSKHVSLADAEIIVSGGRGVKDKEGFQLLEKLADVLGATVGASRVAVDQGWIDHSRQVGQTGQTVRPIVYVACGISGAIQHMVGIEESDYIIAINKNPKAPIMERANLAIEGDLFKVIPELINEIKAYKGIE
jgi:electron transfer flavoprotein alpha subunit